jgi:hypothetical protein
MEGGKPMLQIITLLALALPVIGLIIYAILRRFRDNKVTVRVPSTPNWYK